MNRTLVLTETAHLQIEHRPRPPLAEGEVRLAVDAAGICGSDVHGFAGLNDRRPPGVVMGHETVGTVVEVGPGATRQVGDRVAVNPVVACGQCPNCVRGWDNLCPHRRLYGCCLELDGGLAAEMVARDANCVPVDPDAPLLGLAVIEPMAVGSHAVSVAQLDQGSRVAVIGGGPIGLAVALACGNAAISATVSEHLPARRETAEALGLETCAPEELTASGREFDAAFECVGLTPTVAAALDAVPPGGTVVCVGLAAQTVQLAFADLVVGERRLLGSSAYTAADFADTARWVSRQAERLAPLVQHTVALDAMPGVFADYHAGSLTAMKTVYVSALDG